jgi:site-specific DNA-methyltransferase (adenine-specific)
MWVVAMFIPDALMLAKAWGFKYKTVAFVWEKRVNGKPKANPGMYTMQSTEFCFLFTKGAMTKYFKTRNVKQLVQAEKTGHSVKPEDVRVRIEDLFGDLPRIELFARQRYEGWDAWGNEV